MLQFKKKEIDLNIKNVNDLNVINQTNFNTFINLLIQDKENILLLKDGWTLTHELNNGDRKSYIYDSKSDLKLKSLNINVASNVRKYEIIMRNLS